MLVTNWGFYAPEFTRKEFACSHTGECWMTIAFMETLIALRREYGYPMIVSSGYRHPTHPIEAAKTGGTSGEHTRGACADIRVFGGRALRLMQIATRHGLLRVGVSQAPNVPIEKRFLHLGLGGEGLPSPWLWSYA